MSDWKKDLNDLFKQKKAKKEIEKEKINKHSLEAEKFYLSVVIPAFEELKPELEKHGREVKINVSKKRASIRVNYEGNLEIGYEINVRIYPNYAHPYPECLYINPKNKLMCRSEGHFRSGSQDYSVLDISKEEIIQNYLNEYEIHIKV
jgi:choline/glycine/proline betaine transport protein